MIKFNKTTKLLISIVIFSLVGGNVFGAKSFDNFDSYSNGNLNGQGGWGVLIGIPENPDGFQVQATITQGNSAKAVKILPGTQSTIYKSIGSKSGSIIGWLQDSTSSTTSSIGLYIHDEVGVVGELWFNDTGGIEFWGNTGEVILTDYSPDTWYEVEIEWRNSDGYLRARANSGAWSDWLEPQRSWSTMAYIQLTTAGTAGAGYFDSFTYTGSLLTIQTSDITSMIDYAGELWTDLVPVIALAIGLPLAFYVIRRIIGLVRTK